VRSLNDYIAKLVGTHYLLGALAVTLVVLALLLLSRRGLQKQHDPGVGLRPAAFVIALAAFCIFNFWGMIATAPTGDEPHYLVIAQSVISHATFDLKTVYEQREYLAYYPAEKALVPHVWVKDGQWFPWHGVGLPILSLPFFALAGRAGVVAMLTVTSVAGLAVLWSALLRAGMKPVVATQAILVTGFSLPLVSLSAQVFEEAPAFLLVSLALRAALAPTLTIGELMWLSISVGVLPWLHFKYLALAVILLLLARALHQNVRSLGRLVGPVAILLASIAGLAVLSYDWYGIPIPGVQFAATSPFGNPFVGLAGNLFDQQSGLLFISPVFVLAVPGLVVLRRRARALALGLALIVGVVYFMAGTHYEWYGGENSPARYWAPALPALTFGLASMLSDATVQGRRVFTILAVPGFLLAYLMVAMPAGLVRYGDPATHHNFFISVLERSLGTNLTWLFPSFRSLEPVVWITSLLYALGFAAILRLALRRGRQNPLESQPMLPVQVRQ
jgi:hypothetical protein